MKRDEKFWSRFGGIVRKARNDCPLTPEEAQKELDALAQGEEKPLTGEEVDGAIEKILRGDFEPESTAPDLGWVEGLSPDAVDEEVFALNRNLGEPDPEVDAKVDELRKKASDEEDDEHDKTGLEAPEKPPGKGGGGG